MEPPTEYRADVIQGGQRVAQLRGASEAAVWTGGTHYFMMYGQDGPAELRVYEKRKNRWKFIGGAVSDQHTP